MRFISCAKVTVFVVGLCMMLLTFSNTSMAQTVVRVLGYAWPPFVNNDLKSGLTFDLIDLLNETQFDFQFKMTVSSPNRRYPLMASAQQDMMLFEMKAWGWEGQPVDVMATKPIISSGEVFVALKQEQRGQEFFDDISSKKIGAFFGYHYAFADFNADREWLQNNFQIGLHHDHARILEHVILGQVDVGVVPLAFLRTYSATYPEKFAQLMIGDKMDQRYDMPALIRVGAPIDVATFEGLLEALEKTGQLQSLFERHGLLQDLMH